MLPAARVTDMHTCPMWTGLVPHIGGPVLPPCAVTVLTGFLPAARVGDMLFCAGGPDMVATGSTTVLINAMPAARQTDITAHGGIIVVGYPTVLIGGPAPPAPPPAPAPPDDLSPDEVEFMKSGKSEAELEKYRADKRDGRA